MHGLLLLYTESLRNRRKCAGAFDFAETSDALPEIAMLTTTHESLPWRRRKFEQDAILAELIKTCGISPIGHEVTSLVIVQ